MEGEPEMGFVYIRRATRALSSGILLLMVCSTLACGGPETVIKGNRYVMSGDLASAQVACAPNAPSRKWAVVMGVNFYNDERIPDLGGAVNDAWSFYHFLASPEGGAIDPFRLKLLLNDEATKQGVEDALGEFLQHTCPQDQVIIYFAGHGAPEPDKPDEAYLLVHDTNLDSMVSSAISMGELFRFLQRRTGQTSQLLMFIDACHSGNIQFPGKRGFKKKDEIRLEEETRAKSVSAGVTKLVKGSDGWGAISATAADQLAGETAASCEINGKPYAGGIFTCYLLEGLSGGADANGNGVVTLDEAFNHLKERVSEARDGDQVPQMSGRLDTTMELSNPRSSLVDIPAVPERYLVEALDHPARPFIYVAGGLTLASLSASLFFNLDANTKADELNRFDNLSKTRSEFDTLSDEQASAQKIAFIGYLSTAALAAITLGLTGWDIFDEPEGIEDVYERGPAFQLGVSPTDGGASLQLRLDY
jgi:uncharacterized caspase-like protein